ncbi:HNH endonuclease [Methylobacterium organophilum]|uniref:HNH endonuclease signature motif containing protein n=1 Tax=Methylobacterium organophilum TaxID=410 RepID=UPI0019D07313|nr:HNH endonuclease signature motif containing protein [Methylobacterium organophilum]MBN6819550.1 HNH endonuclease [Methylobacterium organophilum]
MTISDISKIREYCRKDPFGARARKESLLTASDVSALLIYDEDTGEFTWRFKPETSAANKGFNSRYAGKPAGHPSADGYLRIKINRNLYQGSRVAWLLKTGAWPEHGVDHRDGDSRNNRWRNLRAATSVENAHNRALSAKNTSRQTGVKFFKKIKKWGAEIMVNYRNIYLGVYERYEDAVAARKNAEKNYFGEFAPSASRENAA